MADEEIVKQTNNVRSLMTDIFEDDTKAAEEKRKRDKIKRARIQKRKE